MRRQFNQHIVLALFAILITLASGLCAADADKASVPTVAQQKETVAVLEEVYELSAANTKAKKQELISKLMKIAEDAKQAKDTAQLYTILQAIFPLARDTGDFATFVATMNTLTDNFAVDVRKEWPTRLKEFLSGCESAAEFEEVVGQLLPIVERFSQYNQVYEAWELLTAAEAHAKQASASTPTVQQSIDEAKKSVRERGVAFKAQTDAAATLAADPEDQQANYVVGAWLAVFEDDWAGALPKLAKGSNPQWKNAAEAELQVSRITDEQAKMAGLWWDIVNGMSAESSTKRALQRHVHDWYTRVVNNISNPLLKTVVERRIKELKPALDTIAAKPQTTPNNPSPSASIQSSSGTDNRLPIGEAINLLNLITLPEHAIEGSWRTIDGTLVCSPSLDARVMAPVVVSGNYEVHVEFTRNTGTDTISLLCPVGDATCEIFLSGWNGAVAGLHFIDGKSGLDIKDKQAISRPAKLENGLKYALQVKIQETRAAVAVLAMLNGQRFVSWKGSANQLTMHPILNLPSPRSIAVRVHESTATFHSFQLVVRKGGEGYRLQDDWKNPLYVVADAPHRDVAKECATWNGKNYFIAPKPMTYSDAQRLAALLQGRLLTISSQAENQFIYEQAKGRPVWMAGWRPIGSNVWRDERNRPLRMFDWDAREPNNLFGRQLRAVTRGTNPRWDDTNCWEQGYACIEWGEEYP